VSFGVPLNVGTGGEHLDVLKECPDHRALARITTGRSTSNQHIDVHPWSYKSCDADDIVPPKNSAFRNSASNFDSGQIGIAKNSSKLDVRGSRYHTRGRLPGARQAATNQTKDEVTTSGT